jgi:hypothetical protein
MSRRSKSAVSCLVSDTLRAILLGGFQLGRTKHWQRYCFRLYAQLCKHGMGVHFTDHLTYLVTSSISTHTSDAFLQLSAVNYSVAYSWNI